MLPYNYICVCVLLLLLYIEGGKAHLFQLHLLILHEVKLYYLKYSLTFAKLWYNNLQTMDQDGLNNTLSSLSFLYYVYIYMCYY